MLGELSASEKKMFKNVLLFLREFADMYTGKRLPRAAAALSYFLTMTVFPMLIVIYSLLGSSYEKAMRILDFARRFLAEDTAAYIGEFLRYVAAHNSTAMLIAGLSLVLTSASAATRTMDFTIAEMQGGQRFKGARSFVLSLLYSAIFVMTVYFSMVVMLTGREVMARINDILPFVDLSLSWNWMRFVVMFGIELTFIWVIYRVPQKSGEKYHVFTGALIASLSIVADSVVFSIFIGASTRYPLVYGSLSAVILLMFWLYTCGLIIYCGAAINIVVRNMKNRADV